MDEKIYETKDLHETAAISVFANLDPELKKVKNHVVFIYPASKEVLLAKKKFAENDPIPSTEFSRTIKSLRFQMLQTKDGNGNR